MYDTPDLTVLAMRLILAHLCEDPDETAFYVWSILDESGLTSAQFEMANRTAREAASWWWKTPESRERGRQRILHKLEKFTGIAA